MLDPDHADAYFNMALMHQEQALDESCTGLTFLLPPSLTILLRHRSEAK
jgi:hypothetical protein